MTRLSILIPAYEPDHELFTLIEALRKKSALISIIVVNDGSSDKADPVFAALRPFNIHLIEHTSNQGKGAALKTGFAYWLQQIGAHPESAGGIVTADADGQHTLEDILKLVQALEQDPEALHLGCRTLQKSKTPIRSYWGNRLTAFIFSLFVKQALSDTQTGLRGIPLRMLPLLLEIESNGYAFETEMLLLAEDRKIPLREHPIKTVYLNQNRSSHFNPLVDSIKIYWVFIRYTLIAILSALLDFTIFAVSHMLTGHIFLSLILARLCSGSFNFCSNRQVVFKSKTTFLKSAILYMALVLVNLLTAYCFIQGLIWLGLSIYLAKIVSDMMLFVLNFLIQKFFIFKKR